MSDARNTTEIYTAWANAKTTEERRALGLAYNTARRANPAAFAVATLDGAAVVVSSLGSKLANYRMASNGHPFYIDVTMARALAAQEARQ